MLTSIVTAIELGGGYRNGQGTSMHGLSVQRNPMDFYVGKHAGHFRELGVSKHLTPAKVGNSIYWTIGLPQKFDY